MTKQHRRPGLTALTLAVAITLALCAGGMTRAAITTNPTVTNKVMVEGLEAIHYPVAHATKLTCRGSGAAAKGGHTSFRCVATLKGHRERRFYTRAIAKGGWLCAGKVLSDCRLLARGFFATSAADSQGWQQIAVLGWLQAHHITAGGTSGVSCTGTRSPMTCTLRRNPPVTVVINYQKSGGGYIESARRG
jgi:hypothetical protein